MKQYSVSIHFKFLILAFFILGGCAYQPLVVKPTPSGFHLTARITFSKLNEETRRYNVSWKRQPQGQNFLDTFLLQDSFGVTHARLERGKEGIILEAKGERKTYSNDAALTEDVFKRSLPLTSIGYWIIGDPNPKLSYQQPHYVGEHIQSFQQEGWVIQYEQRDPQGFPKKLRFSLGDDEVVVFVRRWFDK